MDKYEYKVRSEEISKLIDKERYADAVKIADTIDWRRVKSAAMLLKIAALYRISRRNEDSREMLMLAYERYPTNRSVVYSLCELSIELDDVVAAIEYYKRFAKLAPKDNGVYTLRYRILEAQEASLEERIEILEELKKKDYQEEWAYELAYLYHRVGLSTKCAEECDDIILWFGDGPFVMKAMELKAKHVPLTPMQQQNYEIMLGNAGQNYSAKNYADSEYYDNNNYDNIAQFPSQNYNEQGYDGQDYDPQGYDGQNYDAQGYGGQNYDPQGYDGQNYDAQGYDGQDYDPQGYAGQNYDVQAYNGQNYDEQGYDGQNYDAQAYARQTDDAQGYDGQNYGADGYSGAENAAQGYDAQNYTAQGYDGQTNPMQGYDGQDYAAQGYEAQGYEAQDYSGQNYDTQGYAPQGGYAQGYDTQSYEAQGYGDQNYDTQSYAPVDYAGQGGYDPVNDPNAPYGDGYDQGGYARDSYTDGYGQENGSDGQYAGTDYSGQDYAGEQYADGNYANQGYPGEQYAPDGYAQQNDPGAQYTQSNFVDDGYGNLSYVDDAYQDNGFTSEFYVEQAYDENGNLIDPGMYSDHAQELYGDPQGGSAQDDPYAGQTGASREYRNGLHLVENTAPPAANAGDMSQYNTINLQKVVAESMKELFPDDNEDVFAEDREKYNSGADIGSGSSIGDTRIFASVTGRGTTQKGQDAPVGSQTQTGRVNIAQMVTGVSEKLPEPHTGAIKKVFIPGDDARSIKTDSDIEELRDTTERSVDDEHSRMEYNDENVYHEQSIMGMNDADEQAQSQMTGPMKLDEVLGKWERIKQDNAKKHQEEIKKRVLTQTGRIFADFDNSIKSGILGELEREEAEAQRTSRTGAVRQGDPAGRPGDGFLDADVTSDIPQQPASENDFDVEYVSKQSAKTGGRAVAPEQPGEHRQNFNVSDQSHESAARAAEKTAAVHADVSGSAARNVYAEGADRRAAGDLSYTEDGYAQDAAAYDEAYGQSADENAGESYAEDNRYAGAGYEQGADEAGRYAEKINEQGAGRYAEEPYEQGADETVGELDAEESGYGEESYEQDSAGYAEETYEQGTDRYAEESYKRGSDKNFTKPCVDESGYAEEVNDQDSTRYAEEPYTDESGYAEETYAQGADENVVKPYTDENGYAEESYEQDSAGYAEETYAQGTDRYVEEAYKRGSDKNSRKPYVDENGYAEEVNDQDSTGYAEEPYTDESGYAEESYEQGADENVEEAYADESGYGEEAYDQSEARYAEEAYDQSEARYAEVTHERGSDKNPRKLYVEESGYAEGVNDQDSTGYAEEPYTDESGYAEETYAQGADETVGEAYADESGYGEEAYDQSTARYAEEAYDQSTARYAEVTHEHGSDQNSGKSYAAAASRSGGAPRRSYTEEGAYTEEIHAQDIRDAEETYVRDADRYTGERYAQDNAVERTQEIHMQNPAVYTQDPYAEGAYTEEIHADAVRGRARDDYADRAGAYTEEIHTDAAGAHARDNYAGRDGRYAGGRYTDAGEYTQELFVRGDDPAYTAERAQRQDPAGGYTDMPYGEDAYDDLEDAYSESAREPRQPERRKDLGYNERELDPEDAESIAEMAKEDALKTQEIKMNTADLSSLSEKIVATTKKEARGARREEIRDFTPEEQTLFENFAVTKKIKKQIIQALENMTLAAYTGNVIITGDAGLDTVRMAKNLIKVYQASDDSFSGKLAKITGEKINQRNIKDVFEKLNNGGIIIEKANGMSEEKLYELATNLNQDTLGIVVIMEDTKKEITKLLEKQAMIVDYFNIRIDLMEMDNNALVAYAKNYALALEYSIDELGTLALYTRIANMQSGNHVVTKDEVRDIIDEAIWKSKKSKIKNFVDVLFARRYDNEDMIVLKERDFM